jgi:hypothetical protein
MGRQAKASALLHFVAEELEALADMDNPRLLRMQLDPSSSRRNRSATAKALRASALV